VEEAGPAGLLTSKQQRRRRRAGGRGGGAAPCPRYLQRSRPRRPADPGAAAEATGAGRVGRAAAKAGVGAEATAMAFLKLRDQVGEGRRGGIAPPGEEGKEGGSAVRAARSAGVRRGERVSRAGAACGGGPETVDYQLVKSGRGRGNPRAAGGLAARARGAGSALASGALAGRRLLFPAR
jgi:hypothetical protein